MPKTISPPLSQCGTQGSQPHPANGSQDAKKPKKPRNNNPGVRTQGGRIYDSENGTTCHQCRQKTVERKAKCKSAKCTLYWCPRCLLNRYGEEVEEVSQRDEWDCPRCRSLCNCSNCRKKAGLGATGILANISRAAGFDSVSALLKQNPHAQRPPTPPTSPPGFVKPKKRPASSLSQQGSGSLPPLGGSQPDLSQAAGGSQPNGSQPTGASHAKAGQSKGGRERSQTVSPGKKASQKASQQTALQKSASQKPASPAKKAKVEASSTPTSPAKGSRPAAQPANDNQQPAAAAANGDASAAGGGSEGAAGQQQPKKRRRARMMAGGAFKCPPTLLPPAQPLKPVAPGDAAVQKAGQGAEAGSEPGAEPLAAMGEQLVNPALQGEGAAKRKRTKPELVDEAELGQPPHPMPALRALSLYTGGEGAEPTPLPVGCCPGDLAEVLEFLQAFGKALELQWVQPGDIAAQLLGKGPPGAGGGVKPRGRAADAPVAAVHTALLNTVAEAHEEPLCGKASDAWQARFAPWLARASADLSSGGDGAAAASPAPRLASPRKPCGAAAAECSDDCGRAPSQGPGSQGRGQAVSFAEALISPAAAADPAVQATVKRGYWHYAPAARLAGLLELCRDALDCWQLRDHMELQAEAAAAVARAAREAKAAARKDAKAEWAAARDKELALLLAGCGEGGLTAEQQKELTAAAAAKADAAAAAAGAGAADAAAVAAGSAAVRVASLGCDRRGALYYDLGCSALLAGSRQLLVDREGPPGCLRQFGSQPDADAVTQSLDARGRCEAPLLKRLAAAEFPQPSAEHPCTAAELPAPPPPAPRTLGFRVSLSPQTSGAGGEAVAGHKVADAVASEPTKRGAPAAAQTVPSPEGSEATTAPVPPPAAAAVAVAPAAKPASREDSGTPTAPLPPAGSGQAAMAADDAEDKDVRDEAQSPAVRRTVAAAAATPADGSPARPLTGPPPSKRSRLMADVVATAAPSPPKPAAGGKAAAKASAVGTPTQAPAEASTKAPAKGPAATGKPAGGKRKAAPEATEDAARAAGVAKKAEAAEGSRKREAGRAAGLAERANRST